jgi:hypothetical protein
MPGEELDDFCQEGVVVAFLPQRTVRPTAARNKCCYFIHIQNPIYSSQQKSLIVTVRLSSEDFNLSIFTNLAGITMQNTSCVKCLSYVSVTVSGRP